MKATALSTFAAWQKGEAGLGYEEFKAWLKEGSFKLFSHPLLGLHEASEAYRQMTTLIQQREQTPNALRFSNIVAYQSGDNYCFQFDSEGTVSGGFPYRGYNIIQLQFAGDRLTGFREYFGFVDKAWFTQ